MILRMQTGFIAALVTVITLSSSIFISAQQQGSELSRVNMTRYQSDRRLPPKRPLRVDTKADRSNALERMMASNRSSRSRDLLAQYGCNRDPVICKQQPFLSLLGPDCCNAICTDRRTDFFNCGVCGKVCFFGYTCCNGACTDINLDARNCGRCNTACPTRMPCRYGMCAY